MAVLNEDENTGNKPERITWDLEEAAKAPRKECLSIVMSKRRTIGRKYDSCKIIQTAYYELRLSEKCSFSTFWFAKSDKI